MGVGGWFVSCRLLLCTQPHSLGAPVEVARLDMVCCVLCALYHCSAVQHWLSIPVLYSAGMLSQCADVTSAQAPHIMQL